MPLVGTNDPEILTVDDVARWCVELSFVVRNNPSEPAVWLSDTLVLYRKIEALSKLSKLQQKPGA